MTDHSAEFRLPERVPQAHRQSNKAEDNGEINAAQDGDLNLQKSSQAQVQNLNLYRADAEEVIARLRGDLDQALMRIGRSDHQSEMLAERLAAAEARVAELEQQISRRREPAARRRLIASLRISFDKIELKDGYYEHREHYSCLSNHSARGRIVYQCKNVDLFLRKAYDLAKTNPLDLMHNLVTLEQFPIQQKEIIEPGYCVQDIDRYVKQLHRAVSQYFDALDGQ